MEVVAEAISLKLPSELLQEGTRYAKAFQVTRAAYIRMAIERMNRETRERLRAERLAEISKRVRRESMHVNTEFAEIEEDPGA